MQELFWIALSLCEKMGNRTIKKIYNYSPTMKYKDFCIDASVKKLIKNENVYEKIIDRQYFNKKIQQAEKLVIEHRKYDIEVISLGNILYPKLLSKIEDPPAVIYVKGNLELLKKMDCIAIIGTRNPTGRGYIAGQKIARTFAEQGFIIVSGLALGIDTAGHRGALAAGSASTIAVMASNLNDVYPKENRELANKIIEKRGLLLSEVPLGKKSFKHTFVSRDRIQSGLSLGICAIQAPLKSGTHHTINFARQQERLVFCPVPTEPISVEQTQGIYKLMDDPNVERIYTADDYLRIQAILMEKKQQLQSRYSPNKENERYNLFDFPND